MSKEVIILSLCVKSILELPLVLDKVLELIKYFQTFKIFILERRKKIILSMGAL